MSTVQEIEAATTQLEPKINILPSTKALIGQRFRDLEANPPTRMCAR